ncbi:hypothetical protein BDR26DRAFT_861131 [Obelidium mucronatum]|nr:hypothetical protein BDR26DRAFT_861131 [Obelidium mucronatum]
MEWLLSFGRAVIFGYDIACKLLSHWMHYGLWSTFTTAALILLFIPGMHVYAHGKNCQCLFGPRIIMGLGLTLEGEGHERFNSVLSRSVGLTQRETKENREMDIVLVVMHHNQGKIKSFATWTAGKLAIISAGLKEIRKALGVHVSELDTTNYKSVCEMQQSFGSGWFQATLLLACLPENLFVKRWMRLLEQFFRYNVTCGLHQEQKWRPASKPLYLHLLFLSTNWLMNLEHWILNVLLSHLLKSNWSLNQSLALDFQAWILKT